MDKKIKTIIAVVVVAIAVVGVSLFIVFQGQDDTSKFIGAWKVIKHFTPDNTLDVTFTFYNNDTAKTVSNYTMGNIQTQWFNYEIDNSRLCLTPQGLSETYAICYGYEFSNNYTALTLTNGTDNTLILTKQ